MTGSQLLNLSDVAAAPFKLLAVGAFATSGDIEGERRGRATGGERSHLHERLSRRDRAERGYWPNEDGE